MSWRGGRMGSLPRVDRGGMTHPSRQPGSVSKGLLPIEDWARLMTVSSWAEVQSSGGTT